MGTAFRSKWTSRGDIISQQVLARTNLISAVLDLRSYEAARLTAFIGRSGTTALACTAGIGGVDFKVFPLPGSTDGTDGIVGPPYLLRSGLTAAVVGRINNAAGYTAGTSTFVVDETSLVPASATEPHLLAMWGTASDPTGLGNGTAVTAFEVAKWSKGAAASLTIDAPCRFAHPDNDYITTQAERWSFEVPGGHVYLVEFDYNDDTAGDNVGVHAVYETLDYIEQITV